MNKRAARQKAMEGGISIGELREMIASARGRGGMSRVNPVFELERTLDIFDAAMRDRDAAEIPTTMRRDPYSRTGRLKPTRDVLLITNILRDAG